MRGIKFLAMQHSDANIKMINMDHLQAVFKPRGVAVVGATERMGSVGRTTLENIISGHSKESGPFEVYPVNPGRLEVLGYKCFPSVSAIDTELCELVIVITPANQCVNVMNDCVRNKSVKVVVVLAAGFKEIGPEGLALEQELVGIASAHGVGVIGPNCLGVMSPHWNLNATFAADSAKRGSVAFISQSGAMCTAVLDWSLSIGLGFSAFVSIGSMSHMEWSHFIRYLCEFHDETKAIILYMETIGNANEFMKAALEFAGKKQIIVIKAGKTEAAAAAAISHTGSLAGSHDAFIAAMTRVGVLVVNTIDELQNVAIIIALQPRPRNNKLYIITNAGGPGVLATDAASISELALPDLCEPMVSKLNLFLPTAWSHANPIDVLGDAKADDYVRALETVMEFGEEGACVLVILSPQSVTEPEPTAEAIADAVKKPRSSELGPIVCSWMGGNQVASGRKILLEAGVPCFAQADIAAQAIGLVCQQVVQYSHVTPAPTIKATSDKKQQALQVLAAAIKESRTILTESESKEIMKIYGIDVAESIVCYDVETAIVAANKVRFPCVIKLNSETITHKSDVGGVKLNIRNNDEVRAAWNSIKENVDKIGPQHFQGGSVQPMLDISSGIELLVGSSVDNQFGPMVLFGTGGCMVEIFKDAATAVPPLDRNGSKRLIADTKISAALYPGHGDRFKGCPIQDVEDTLMKFSELICDLHETVSECEINPLLALKDRVIALDARVVLKEKDALVVPPCLL